jgi:hypothetical protein
MMDFGKAANGGEVFGCEAQDVLELLARFVVLSGFEECAAEGDVSGEIRGVPLQPGRAGRYGFFVPAGPPVFLREGRKRNRRRIHLDPAS